MEIKKIQLAHLYRSGRFYGFGIAVDGELLDNQIGTVIETDANMLPIVTAKFHLDGATANNPIVIELPDSFGGKNRKVNS